MYYNLPVTISNINTQYLRQLSPSRLSAIVKNSSNSHAKDINNTYKQQQT